MRNFVILYSVVLLGYCSSLKQPGSKSAKSERSAESILKEKDYYKILGVEKTATDKDIGRAFRKLAIQFHPDKSKHPDALKIFQRISEAYDVLSDPEKRRRYDREGSGGFNFQNNGGSFDFSNFNFDNLFNFGDDLDDEFNSMFGGGKKFKLFEDIPNIFDSMRTLRNLVDQNDHFGGGDSFFKEFSGGQVHARASSFQQQGQQQPPGRNCRTVTTRVGNTVSTYTTCT